MALTHRAALATLTFVCVFLSIASGTTATRDRDLDFAHSHASSPGASEQSPPSNVGAAGMVEECDVSDLLAEKESVLSDLREGRYCATCMRTATELGKAGQDFEAHFENTAVKRAVGPAKQSVIDAKSRQWDRLIAARCKGQTGTSLRKSEITASETARPVSKAVKAAAPSNARVASPIAGFTMKQGSSSAVEGQTLEVKSSAVPISVTFTANRGTAPNGAITRWAWKINGKVASQSSSFTYGLSGNTTIGLVVTDKRGITSQEATGKVVINTPPPVVIRKAPYDFFNTCNHTSQVAGEVLGVKVSDASAVVFSDPKTGKLEFNVQAAGMAGTAVGRAGVGVNYDSKFTGRVKISAQIRVSGSDTLAATGLRILRVGLKAGSAFVESDAFISASPPVDVRSTSRFRAGLLTPLKGGDAGNPLLVTDKKNFNPPLTLNVQHMANVKAGQRLSICAGAQAKVGATTPLISLTAWSKALYNVEVLEIRIEPQ
jgi:hypothetical protein